MSSGDDNKDVVNLSEVRRKQKVARHTSKRASDGPSKPVLTKILGYAQVILFLALVAYFMRLCQGPRM